MQPVDSFTNYFSPVTQRLNHSVEKPDNFEDSGYYTIAMAPLNSSACKNYGRTRMLSMDAEGVEKLLQHKPEISELNENEEIELEGMSINGGRKINKNSN